MFQLDLINGGSRQVSFGKFRFSYEARNWDATCGDLWLYLAGKRGVIQFLMSVWPAEPLLPGKKEEYYLAREGVLLNKSPILSDGPTAYIGKWAVRARDIGFHSPRPCCDVDYVHTHDCSVLEQFGLGKTCYYDGSSLEAIALLCRAARQAEEDLTTALAIQMAKHYRLVFNRRED